MKIELIPFDNTPVNSVEILKNLGKHIDIVAVDRSGKLAYESNVIDRRGVSYRVIEVLTEKASDAYLSYLQTKGISYIFAGAKDLDCAECLRKLKTLFGIENLMIAGGGTVDWVFADAGLVDELSLVLAPSADGEDRVTVFEKNDRPIHSALAFSLIDVQVLEGDTLWLRYAPKNVKA